VEKWPGHSRYGARAGKKNEEFLRADVLEEFFTRRLMPYRERVAVLIFEFGTFAKASFPEPEAFFTLLHQFLRALPEGFRYAVEIRNPEYLGDDYFGLLSSRNVAHVFNSWTRMPELSKQIEKPGAFTAEFSVVRALLTKGRTYEKAVETFEPYDRIQEPNSGTREAIRKIAERAWKTQQPAYVFVNNRLGGRSCNRGTCRTRSRSGRSWRPRAGSSRTLGSPGSVPARRGDSHGGLTLPGGSESTSTPPI
jgi:uncharacterized protein YecE (DUF72 family)